ncbi:hypothetical protein ACFX14_037560 [Malus domestica]
MANPILSFIDLVDGGLSKESDKDEYEKEEDESEKEDEEEGTVDVDSVVYLADQTGAAGSAPEMAAVRNGDEVGSAECSQGNSGVG